MAVARSNWSDCLKSFGSVVKNLFDGRDEVDVHMLLDPSRVLGPRKPSRTGGRDSFQIGPRGGPLRSALDTPLNRLRYDDHCMQRLFGLKTASHCNVNGRYDAGNRANHNADG
jgi:hypothetical protein